MTPKQIVQLLEEYKAQDVVKIDIRKLTDIADFMIICTGTSTRHVQTLAKNLVTQAKQHKMRPLGVEEDPNGSWTLVDLGDIIVHIMLPQTREFYKLEKLWEVELIKKNRHKK